MDLKKLASSDHFRYSVSPRRKVVSGFGLGVVASFIVASVVLFNVSFKAPFLNPMLQGLHSLGANNTPVVHWPFSFSSSTNGGSSAATTTTELQNTGGTKQKVGKGMFMNKTHEANVSDTNGKAIASEEINVENFSNASSTVEGMDPEKVREVGGTLIDKNSNFTASGKEGMVLEKKKTHLGNFSETGGDGIAENGVEGKVAERHANGSSLGRLAGSTVDSNIRKIVGNLSSTGESIQSLGKKIRASDMNSGGVPSEPNYVSNGSYDPQLTKMQSGSFGNCDIFHGRWVRDETKPYYPAGSCPYIDRDFDCHLNRRPDDGFLKWKWQPYGCDIPSLNATDFLERLRGKKLVFVGDSLNRNMWESLVCILHHSIGNKKNVYEISGRTEFKKKGFYAFRFEDYNCSVDFVSAPFLVRESSFTGRNSSFETLRLDLMDQTTSMYHDADVVIFNTGHWWTHEKTSRGEDYYQEGNHVYRRLKVLEAYKKALRTWARWVDKNIDGNRTQVIFRGYSVTHFRGGQWNSGGQCHKEIEPIFNETYLAKYPSKMRALEHVLQEMRIPVMYLNISKLTDYRKDGHPSIYRKEYKTVEEQIAAEQSQDCSHWCLPGVPDTWNELLYASLLRAGKGSWRSS